MNRPQIFRRSVSRVSASLAFAARVTSRGGVLVAAAFLFVLVFYVTTDVCARFLFRAPFKGTLEVSQIMFLVLMFFSIADTQASKAHVEIELLSSRWSPRWQALLGVLSSAIAIGLFTLMIQYGLKASSADLRGGLTTDQLRIPIFLVKLAIPVGASLMIVQLIVDFLEYLQQLITKR